MVGRHTCFGVAGPFVVDALSHNGESNDVPSLGREGGVGNGQDFVFADRHWHLLGLELRGQRAVK